VVSSILKQLLLYVPELSRTMVGDIELLASCIEKQSLLPRLLQIYKEMAYDFDRIFIVLDGIDELSPDTTMECSRTLRTFHEMGASVLISANAISRAGPQEEVGLVEYFKLVPSTLDLQVFLKYRIECSALQKNMTDHVKDHATKVLAEQANGKYV
jgi:hypothetical protein